MVNNKKDKTEIEDYHSLYQMRGNLLEPNTSIPTNQIYIPEQGQVSLDYDEQQRPLLSFRTI